VKANTIILGVGLVTVSTFRGWAEEKFEANSDTAPVVAVARVSRENLEKTITLSAEFKPYQQIDVHSKVSGFVKEMKVDVGDHVKIGDTIAILEIPELKEDLKKAAAATRGAEEDVKRAKAKFEETHLAGTRLEEVAKQQPNLVAEQDIDAAKSLDLEAEAVFESAKQHVEECQANEKKIQTMLEYGVITAPFDGVITKRYADTGALIQAGTTSNTQAMPVVSLAQDNQLRLIFPVPEKAVSAIRTGQAVRIEVPATGAVFTGAISRYARQVDRATRSMQTEVDVENTGEKLTAGMYATVILPTDQKKSVLAVPVQSLSPGTDPTVYVLNKKNQIEERHVVVGMETPQKVEILRGLEENDLVFIGNRSQARLGQQVIPKIVEIVGMKMPGDNGNG